MREPDSQGAEPLLDQVEEVERVRVAATRCGPSQGTYITASGREVAAATVEVLR